MTSSYQRSKQKVALTRAVCMHSPEGLSQCGWHRPGTVTPSTLSIHSGPWTVLATGHTEVSRMLPPRGAQSLPGETGRL